MRYYVKFDESGKLVKYMTYAHLNATMREVSEEEYARILAENGVEYEPEPEAEAEPSHTITERVASLEATKAERADVDELQEALNMILTGVTE